MSQVRFNLDIYLDDEKDKDIIGLIEDLKSKHKLSPFVSTMLKLVADGELNNDTYKSIKNDIDSTEHNLKRTLFFNELRDEVSDIKDKTDKIYEMALHTYISNMIGKNLNLENGSKNILIAEFMMEQSIKRLQNICGFNIEKSTFLANKRLENIDELVDTIMEAIVTRYSGLIDELKIHEVVTTGQIVSNSTNSTIDNTNSVIDNNKTIHVANNDNVKPQASVSVEDTQTETDDTKEKDEEVIDFGDADLDALANFFGGI